MPTPRRVILSDSFRKTNPISPKRCRMVARLRRLPQRFGLRNDIDIFDPLCLGAFVAQKIRIYVNLFQFLSILANFFRFRIYSCTFITKTRQKRQFYSYRRERRDRGEMILKRNISCLISALSASLAVSWKNKANPSQGSPDRSTPKGVEPSRRSGV